LPVTSHPSGMMCHRPVRRDADGAAGRDWADSDLQIGHLGNLCEQEEIELGSKISVG